MRYKENGYAEKVQQVTVAPESLRYGIYLIPNSISFLPSFSDFEYVNTQHNVHLYMNLG